jgi:hypothetical protein
MFAVADLQSRRYDRHGEGLFGNHENRIRSAKLEHLSNTLGRKNPIIGSKAVDARRRDGYRPWQVIKLVSNYNLSKQELAQLQSGC